MIARSACACVRDSRNDFSRQKQLLHAARARLYGCELNTASDRDIMSAEPARRSFTHHEILPARQWLIARKQACERLTAGSS